MNTLLTDLQIKQYQETITKIEKMLQDPNASPQDKIQFPKYLEILKGSIQVHRYELNRQEQKELLTKTKVLKMC